MKSNLTRVSVGGEVSRMDIENKIMLFSMTTEEDSSLMSDAGIGQVS